MGQGSSSFNDPLPWWKERNVNRRVFALPATSAYSERLFSEAGHIVTKRRSCLGNSNVELLLFLRTVWPVLETFHHEDHKGKHVGKREKITKMCWVLTLAQDFVALPLPASATFGVVAE